MSLLIFGIKSLRLVQEPLSVGRKSNKASHHDGYPTVTRLVGIQLAWSKCAARANRSCEPEQDNLCPVCCDPINATFVPQFRSPQVPGKWVQSSTSGSAVFESRILSTPSSPDALYRSSIHRISRYFARTTRLVTPAHRSNQNVP